MGKKQNYNTKLGEQKSLFDLATAKASWAVAHLTFKVVMALYCMYLKIQSNEQEKNQSKILQSYGSKSQNRIPSQIPLFDIKLQTFVLDMYIKLLFTLTFMMNIEVRL